jgi:glycosyltransferase involved in cell wall biosynthesis
MERHRIGIVIPALNEASTIAAIVSGAAQHGLPIVVDDGSSDETGALAAAAGAMVFRSDTNVGYDEALNIGFSHAEKLGCEYVVTLDADGQHDPKILASFIHALDDGADVVVGTRDRRQRLTEYIFSWVALAKWGILDPLCGIKAYRMDTYREQGYFDSYCSCGTELAIYAAKNDKTIAQIAIVTSDRVDASRFGKISANKKILCALWFSLFPRITNNS